jgi:hypothetical protein
MIRFATTILFCACAHSPTVTEPTSRAPYVEAVGHTVTLRESMALVRDTDISGIDRPDVFMVRASEAGPGVGPEDRHVIGSLPAGAQLVVVKAYWYQPNYGANFISRITLVDLAGTSVTTSEGDVLRDDTMRP